MRRLTYSAPALSGPNRSLPIVDVDKLKRLTYEVDFAQSAIGWLDSKWS